MYDTILLYLILILLCPTKRHTERKFKQGEMLF
jgi:hypothetical protein